MISPGQVALAFGNDLILLMMGGFMMALALEHNGAHRRLALAMVNEAARCLEESIIADPAQLDMALLYGTGFPPAHGGLLRWADGYGLARLVDRLDRFAARIGPRFVPAPLLRDLARRQGAFHGYA